jgi:hypothetical protein
MWKKINFCCFGLGLVFISCCAAVFSQGKDTDVRQKRVTIQMSDRPLYTVFSRLVQKYDVAIGFEESVLDRKHRHYYFETNIAIDHGRGDDASDKEMFPPMPRFKEHLISVNFVEAKLEDVMDKIVDQMVNYDWKVDAGVINIFPKRGRDPRIAKLLEIKVSDFGVGSGSDINAIHAQLMLHLPEFKSFLADNDLEAETGRVGSVLTDRILPDGLRFSNLTFRQLLNAITRVKRGGWMIQIKERPDAPGKEFVEILI